VANNSYFLTGFLGRLNELKDEKFLARYLAPLKYYVSVDIILMSPIRGMLFSAWL
jgi:hypothetical protein